VQVLEEFEFFVCDLVLLHQFVVLLLKSTHRDFEQLVFALALHRAVVVKLALRLLIFILFLPTFDLLTHLLLRLLLLLLFAPLF